MTYLPFSLIDETVFPLAYGKDLLQALSIVEEKWARFYPRVNYYSLNKSITPMVEDNVDQPVGEPGTTAFDPLWGEVVDPQMLVSGWTQPHRDESDTLAAGNPEQFLDPVKLHAQIRREAKDQELKKLGFDEVRTLLLTIPLSLLDRADVTVQHGDRIVLDNETYRVEQFTTTGYWKNTNVRIYMVLNCQHARFGS